MVRLLAVLLLVGCTTPAMDPNLSLYDRFVLTALTKDDGTPSTRLYRWSVPLMLRYDGPDEYRVTVERQAVELAEIAGVRVDLSPRHPNFFVEISDRDTPNNCQVIVQRGRAEVHIWSELPAAYIRRCLVQEMAQGIGPGGDLDGVFGSRSDTVFASHQTATELTQADRQVLAILFDPRLRSGMTRREVLAVLPEIVADVEAEQTALK